MVRIFKKNKGVDHNIFNSKLTHTLFDFYICIFFHLHLKSGVLGQRAVLATEPRAHFPAKGEATGEQTFFF